MARFFVPLDVNYQLDDKIMSAGYVAECLYVRALAYCKRAGTEGRIKRSQLRALALGLPGRPAKHADVLVEVGLWGTDDDGYRISGWLNHNLSNDQMTEQKAKIRVKSIAGNHKRHHVAKGVVDEDCELCNPPTGERETSQQGEEMLARRRRETKTKTKTKTREEDEDQDEDEDEDEGIDRSGFVEKRVCQSRVTETGPRLLAAGLAQILGETA